MSQLQTWLGPVASSSGLRYAGCRSWLRRSCTSAWAASTRYIVRIEHGGTWPASSTWARPAPGAGRRIGSHAAGPRPLRDPPPSRPAGAGAAPAGPPAPAAGPLEGRQPLPPQGAEPGGQEASGPPLIGVGPQLGELVSEEVGLGQPPVEGKELAERLAVVTVQVGPAPEQQPALAADQGAR